MSPNDPDDVETYEALGAAFDTVFEESYSAPKTQGSLRPSELLAAAERRPSGAARWVGLAAVAVVGLLGFAAWQRSASSGRAATEPAGSAQPRQATDARPSADTEPQWKALSREGRHREAYGTIENSFPEVCRAATADELWMLADLAKLVAQPDQAVVSLKAFRTRFGDDARLAVAALELGALAESKRDHQLALRWYAKAIAESTPPTDVHREASARALRVVVERVDDGDGGDDGDDGQARDRARAYLEHYPSGPAADRARSALDR